MKRDEWYCGYAAALAAILRRPDGDRDLVCQTMIGDGVSLGDLQRGGVEDYDLKPIRDAVNKSGSLRSKLMRVRQ